MELKLKCPFIQYCARIKHPGVLHGDSTSFGDRIKYLSLPRDRTSLRNHHRLNLNEGRRAARLPSSAMSVRLIVEIDKTSSNSVGLVGRGDISFSFSPLKREVISFRSKGEKLTADASRFVRAFRRRFLFCVGLVFKSALN